ncbi:elongin-A [Mobula birostris]|uniref:elongin-A n=1 Tax=Mobula birostris TaxID=1983395 RepID=UPI003B28202C
MAADGVQEKVLKLQSRLSATQEPKKLLKTLKRLNELPVTVDILADTGIGKTVNGFRKHDVIGESAKNLVSKWKKLVPQEVERSTNTLEEREFTYNKGVSKKKHREPSPEDYRQTFQTPHGESYESNYEHVPVKGRHSLETEKSYTYSSHGYQSKSHSKEHVERWTKSPPVEDYGNKIDSSDEDAEQTMQPFKSFHKTHQDHHSSRAEVGTGRDKDHKSSHKEKQHSVLKGEEKYKLSSLQMQDKTDKSCSKEQYNHRDQGDYTSVSSSHKKPRLQTEENFDDRKYKHRGSDKQKFDHDEQRSTLDKPKEKPTSSKPKEEVESKKSKSAEKNQSASFQKDSTDAAVADEFEEPTMSFESYLSYDQPQKRKKKISKPASGKVKETQQLKSRGSGKSTSKLGSKGSSSSYGEQNVEEKKKAKRRPEDVPHVKSKKMMIDVVPVLPDIPLPNIQPNYRPLPSMDLTPLSPPKRKAVSILSEEDLGFTGRRFNSKMQVYSGSKIVYLPKMMSLFEQCIRVLQNNVDSIHEVGGVPFEILEPVLERCTPDQLYRIENCNPTFVEETDHLWLRHCKRDFKNQDRQEFESWREMYLRLHDEREQKLRAITQSISSAHASKPKGRQAKLAFLNTEVKPPRDVRRRQEKHGTGMSVPAPLRIKMQSQIGNSSSGGGNQSFDGPGPSSSHGSSASSVTIPNSGGGIHESKKQVKKIAPMMAKTIKFFKNRFSRR